VGPNRELYGSNAQWEQFQSSVRINVGPNAEHGIEVVTTRSVSILRED